LPTEQHSVQVKQEFTDIVWELRDGTILHMEVQTRKPTNLHRFLRYDAWLAEHFQTRVRTVILYNAAIAHAADSLDFGCAQYRVENVYLKEFDGDDTLETVATHLTTGAWEPADRIRLALALQMRHSQSTDDVLERMLALTRQLEDEYEQAYVTTLILGINGNRLSKAQRERLREGLKMTNIVKEIWHDALDEGMQKGIEIGMEKGIEKSMEKGREQGMEKGIEKGIETGLYEGKKVVARAMLARGMETATIAELTGLGLTEVEELQNVR
jgi:hypothetical protein